MHYRITVAVRPESADLHEGVEPALEARLDSELKRLDRILTREVRRFRQRYQLSPEEWRGDFISDEQVDAALAAGSDDSRIDAEEEIARQTLLPRAALSDVAQDLLILALAPCCGRRYGTLFAYLQDDVSLRLPTLDLALRLFAPGPQDRTAVRRAVCSGASPLVRLLAGGRACGTADDVLRLRPEVSDYLLGVQPAPAPPSTTWENVHVNGDDWALLRSMRVDGFPVMLETPDAGLAETIARAACNEWGIPLTPACEDFETACVMQLLFVSGIFVSAAHVSASLLHQAQRPVFIHAVPEESSWRAALENARVVRVPISELDYHHRCIAWSAALDDLGKEIPADVSRDLAARFRLSPSRIAAAAQQAADRRSLDQPGHSLNRAHLFEAARAQSESGLGQLAVKMTGSAAWDDLVLPPATLSVLKEFSAAAEHREIVYSEWGLGGTETGLGVKAVFSGASGTGKTMSAVVVARELGLDLYRIDLSQVVSKYIGETEKNLDRIFNTAARSNAVLLFDEADALFGKRSAVRDAHDRYANIEVGYLLQKLDDYTGVAILATNLSGNMDEAFARRLQYAVEFPLPDEALRLALWRKAFPPAVPVDPSLDFALVARQHKLTGGEIRSISITSAFLAATECGCVSAAVLARAINRHLIRSGRIPAQTASRVERTTEARRAT